MFMLLLQITVIAQNTITGKVISEDTRKPLESAVITIKNQKRIQSISDENGNFTINTKLPQVVLVISYTGYETQEIRTSSQTGFVVSLKRDNRQLDEVVVTGYSTQNKKFIAGSITTVKGDDIKDNPVDGLRAQHKKQDAERYFNNAIDCFDNDACLEKSMEFFFVHRAHFLFSADRLIIQIF